MACDDDFYLSICHGFAAQAIPDEFRFVVLGISPLPACSTGGAFTGEKNRDIPACNSKEICPIDLENHADVDWYSMRKLDAAATATAGRNLRLFSLVSFKLVGDRNETLDLLGGLFPGQPLPRSESNSWLSPARCNWKWDPLMTFCFSCSEVVQLAVFGERIGKWMS